jgi:lipopolysaccharide heptosyltransferase II
MNAPEEVLRNKKILIINVNWIGDVLFSTPAIRLIKESYPSSYLGCMIVPRCKEVLENNPYVDELILFDERTTHRSLFSKLKFILFLKEKNFDIAFIFHRSFTRTLICWLANIPQRIGYYRKKSSLFLTKKIEVTEGIHRVDYFLNLLKAEGLNTENKDCQFFIKEENRHFASQFLKDNRIEKSDLLVSLNPGGNWRLKRWPPENFALLGDLIVERYKAKILISGAEKDRQLALDIAKMMKHKPIIAAGKTTLAQLAALYEQSHLVISGDSGPLHIAICVKTPTVALFGPTSPKITGPIGSSKFRVIQEDVGCVIPCYKLNCTLNRCMYAITPYKVIEIINKEKLI